MKDCKRLFKDLKQEYDAHKGLHKDIQKYIAPTRGSFDSPEPNKKKSIDHKILLDSHATYCLKVFSSGLTSGLTSPSRPWFKLGLPDQSLSKYRPVREYLEDVQKIMMGAFSKSNIYGVLNNAYEEMGAFGTGCFSVEEDFKDLVRGKSYTAGEYYFGVDSNGRANQFGREFSMSVYQLVDAFGYDNVSDRVKNLYNEKKYQVWVKVIHYVGPNYKQDLTIKNNKNFDFLSVYWEETNSEEKYLKESGFKFFPVIGARWGVTTTSDTYGFGPSVESLGDVKMLQKLQRLKLEGTEKIINPPTQADASIIGDVNTFPGGVTRSGAAVPNAGVRPAYQINPNINDIRMTIEDTKQSIGKFFYTDMFLMMQGDTRSGVTAREVVERHEEKLLMLGPTLERIENEMLDPLIDVTFNYLTEMNVLPPAPKELGGMEIKVEYISTLAQAQKMVGMTSIAQVTQFAGGLSAVKPDVLDVLNLDEMLIEYAEDAGISARGYRTKSEVDEIRNQRAQAQQAQQQSEQMMSMVQGAKTLSDTHVNNNSALDAILGVRANA